jgi:uncharacterized Zn-binding protein involved in type VI secretion
MNSARVTDVWAGKCCCHLGCTGMSGVIVSGDNTVLINGLPSARMTDLVVGNCGHSGIIVSGSNTVTASNLAKSRLGDSVTGCTQGVIVTGSPDTMTY